MANQQKPLTYLSLKCVLQYCKADLRIFLSQHFPFIHRIEKSIPLKIEKLHLEPFVVRINDTEYRLKTIRKFPNSPPFGSFQCDLDEFGVPDRHGDYELTPGDVQIEHGGEKPHLIEEQTLETLEFIMTQLTRRDMLRWDDPILKRKPKFAIPELVDPSYCDVQLSDFVWFYGKCDNSKPFFDKYREKNTSGNSSFIEYGMTVKFIDGKCMRGDVFAPVSGSFICIAHRNLTRAERLSLTEQLKTHILPFQLRQHNIESFAKCYLQLTTVSPHGKTTEVVEYTQKMHVAMKYLNEKIFGGRRLISVDQLRVGNKGGVLRLPCSLKVDVNQLQLEENGNSVIDSFRSILVDSSFSLKSIECHCWELFAIMYSHPVIEEAKTLIVPPLQVDINWAYCPEKLMVFIRNVIEYHQLEQEVCDHYTFGITSSSFAEDILLHFMNEPSATISEVSGVRGSTYFPHRIHYPVTDSTDLTVYEEYPARKRTDANVTWVLTVKVCSKNSAKTDV